MDSYRTVSSFSSGTIEQVFVDEGAYVYEWEPLFLIKTECGLVKKVEVGVSGIISSLHVQSGDRVISEMTLAVLEEDVGPSGSD